MRNLPILNPVVLRAASCAGAIALAACSGADTKSDTGADTKSDTGPDTTSNKHPQCGTVEQRLSDFTYSAGTLTDRVAYGTPGKVFSGTIQTYGMGINADVTGGDMHVSGAAASIVGLQANFDTPCVADATSFAGLSFDVWGTIGDTAPHKNLTFWVGTLEDSPTAEWLATLPPPEGIAATLPNTPGSCTPTSGDRLNHPGCKNPSHQFALSGTQASPQRVSVKWSDFAGGEPIADASPGRITVIGLRFPAPTGIRTPNVVPYDLDVHVDNLAFIPR